MEGAAEEEAAPASAAASSAAAAPATEETADATPETRRRESAVAFQLPEEPVVRARTVPDSDRQAAHEVPKISLRRPSRAKSTAELERTAPGNDDLDQQDLPSEDLVPVVRKTRRLRTAEAVQRCKSDDRAPKDKPQASLAVPSTPRRARSISNSRLEVDDAMEDSRNSPAPVTRKPRRIRTVERHRKSPEPSTSSKSEDDMGDNLVPVLRSARRPRTHSPGRQATVVDPGPEADHEEERIPILRRNRRLRTLSPGSRLGQEPAPRDVDEEDVPAKPTPRANRKTQRLPTFGTREAGDAPHSSQAAESPSKLKSTKTMGPRSLAEAARKAVAAVDAEEEERAKSSRIRMPLKAVVDFAGVANAAAAAGRKARRRTIARKETTATPAEAEEEKPPPAPRDLELIRMTFSNARRGLAMAREAMSLQIVSPFFLLKTVIKSLGKAALIIKEKRRARGWKILRVFLAAKKRQDFLKAQQEYNSRIQLDDIMEEHLNNIFWQFVIFEVDAYEEILQELVKVFAEPGAGVKEDLPALRQQLERHLQSLEQELQDRILAGDRESIDTASKTRSDMRKSLEKIMSEAATLRSLVVYSRQISRVGRTEKNTALADARLLDDIKNLQVSRRLMRKMKRQEREQKRLEAGKPPLRRRRPRNAGGSGKGSRVNSKGRSSSKTKKEDQEEQADASSSSSSSSDTSGSSSEDDYSDSEGDESEDQTDDESVQVEEGPQEDSMQDADVFDSCRAESVATPLTLGESTECPDDAQRATPLDIGVTPPLLPLPEEQRDTDTEPSEILPIRTVSGASISLGPQWSRLGSKASVAGDERQLIEEAADVEAKAVVHSSVDWQATVAEFMVGRRAEDYLVLDRDQLVVPMFAEDWTQQLHSTVDFPVTIQHREAPLVVEYSTQWTEVVGSYMAGRDLEEYEVFDRHEELIPLFEEVWKPSTPLPSFPIRIQRKESAPGSPRGSSAVSSREGSKKRTTAARRRRYGNAIFRWEEVEGLADEATPEPGDPARTLTTDAEALQAFDDLFNEGSESRTECFVDQSFAWLEDSVLPQKVKLNLEKCRSRPLGQVPIKMPFLLRRGRLRATTAFSTPRQYEVDSEEAESTLGSVKRVRKAHDNCPSLDQVCELREQNAESERIIHSWRENKAAAPIPKLSLKPVLGRSKVPWEDSPHLANMPFGHIAKPRFNRFPSDLEPQSQVVQSSTSGSARRHLRGTQMLGKTRSSPWQVKDERRQMFPLVSFHRSLCKVQV